MALADEITHLPQYHAVAPISVVIEQTGPSDLVVTVHGSCLELCIQTEKNASSATSNPSIYRMTYIPYT